MIGLKRGTVELIPHQEEWDKNAQEIITILKQILENIAVDIQHIGSTAIPSINAKPIIDIVVGVRDLNDIFPYIELLKQHGFIYRREDAAGQILFVMGDFENDTRTHHIHIVKWNEADWNNYINFRDYLNAYPEKAMMYDNLKRKLAMQFSNDRKKYTAGKKELIRQLLKEAVIWRGEKMSTLYVSDLDGTLLRSNEKTSEYTNHVINRLTERGMIFSYATARSLVTAKKVTSGINAKIPLIVYNGAFVIDNLTEDILIANYFDDGVDFLLDDLFANKVYPIVYAYIDGKEKFSFVSGLCSDGTNKFLDRRKGDIRTNAVRAADDLKSGNIFYITCIDESQKLEPLYEKYKASYHCIYQTDIYTNEQWLEIMPLNASKAKAIKQLQSLLKYEKLIVFGDGKNDIDMFEMADESYAVQNAHEDLKRIATSIISSNDEDGVAKWLDENFVME